VTREYTTSEVLEVYERHPLSMSALIARLEREGRDIRSIGEDDLAYDPTGEVTDQNHIGGAPFTHKLAASARVVSSDRVLDLGCGLGGPARLLAATYGCAVHGIDANPARVADAAALSELVGLARLTTFQTADFLECAFAREYTVVWGQNSWIHMSDRLRLARHCAAALVPAGRIAFDDVCLKRTAATHDEQTVFDAISDAWRSAFVSVGAWQSAFESAGFSTTQVEEDSGPFMSHCEKLTALAMAQPETYPPHEVLGWRCALHLGRSGVFGFFRIVAVRR
jgi:SAM-dependent methyltransferase